MILYFSATGNSLDTAELIAEATGDDLLDMGKMVKEGDTTVRVEQGESLGFVFPVYRWSTPSIIDRFIRNAVFLASDGERFVPDYCYCVITYGYFPGNESRFFQKELMRAQGFGVDSFYNVKSAENCIYVSNPPTGNKAQSKIAAEREQARGVAARIASGERGSKAKRNLLGILLSNLTGTAEKPRSTKPFYVIESRCIGCGTCAAVCPMNCILLNDGFPSWHGDECAECFACLHRCPTEAVQFGKSSLNRNRYLNPILSNGSR